MRELARLLVVAILSFAVVGGAMLYSRGLDVQAMAAELIAGTGDKIAQLTGQDSTASSPDDSDTRLFIPRPRQNAWLGLSGFPDQMQLSFPIPPGVDFTNGQLKLKLDSQLADRGDGLVSIALNGRPRGQVVLNPGRELHEVDIDLDAADLMSGSLLLDLASRGSTNAGQICPTEAANSGSAIALLPESGLTLTAVEPIDDPDVRLLALAEPLTLALGNEGVEQAAAIWAAQDLARTGIDLDFAADGVVPDIHVADLGGVPVVGGRGIALVGVDGVDHLAALRAPSTIADSGLWPVGVDWLGAETLVKTFRASRRWQIDYKLADLPGGLTPTRFDLALATSTLAAGSDWVVRVTLNGSLLDTERFDGGTKSIALPVTLPLELQGLSNQLVVELVDTSPNQSICRNGPDAEAQLLPETRLLIAGGQPVSGWGALVRDLAGADSLGIAVEGTLDAGQAQRASHMLGQFLPRHADMAFANARVPAKISIATRAALQSAQRIAGLGRETPNHSYLVTAGHDGKLTLTDLATADLDGLLDRLSSDDIALLVRY